MGKLRYDDLATADFEDRTLAHLQIVICAKLRRGESFPFTWRDDVSLGDGRTTVWMHPLCSLSFKFHGSRSPEINRAWVEALLYTANSTIGMYVVPEPPASSHSSA